MSLEDADGFRRLRCDVNLVIVDEARQAVVDRIDVLGADALEHFGLVDVAILLLARPADRHPVIDFETTAFQLLELLHILSFLCSGH